MKNFKQTAHDVQLMQTSVSLLQHFEKYKNENPEAVRMKEYKDDERQYFDKCLPLNVVEKIEAIHKDIEEKEYQKQRKEEVRQNMAPTINMHIKYYFPGQRSAADCVDEDDIDVFDIEDKGMFDTLMRDDSPNKSRSRLEITVEDAYNIDAWLKKKEKVLKAAIRCHVIPDSDERGPKLKTEYHRVSFDYARWDHKFVFQGFTIEQILDRKFKFTLRIKTNNTTRDVGYCIFNPNKCAMANVTEEEKEFCTFDTDFWMKFLHSPSVPIEVIIPIIKAKNKTEGGDEVSRTVTDSASQRNNDEEDSSVFKKFKSIF